MFPPCVRSVLLGDEKSLEDAVQHMCPFLREQYAAVVKECPDTSFVYSLINPASMYIGKTKAGRTQKYGSLSGPSHRFYEHLHDVLRGNSYDAAVKATSSLNRKVKHLLAHPPWLVAMFVIAQGPHSMIGAIEKFAIQICQHSSNTQHRTHQCHANASRRRRRPPPALRSSQRAGLGTKIVVAMLKPSPPGVPIPPHPLASLSYHAAYDIVMAKHINRTRSQGPICLYHKSNRILCLSYLKEKKPFLSWPSFIKHAGSRELILVLYCMLPVFALTAHRALVATRLEYQMQYWRLPLPRVSVLRVYNASLLPAARTFVRYTCQSVSSQFLRDWISHFTSIMVVPPQTAKKYYANAASFLRKDVFKEALSLPTDYLLAAYHGNDIQRV